ncbi:hypothetical protein H4R20_000871 [Coemansia guatemalensis]|uniref:SWIB-domain-containing protein n=1 Tax=Coemansia guatemalensis TaxID=2761395 RepID=A0A9W8I0D4_9FUNG|nr:hypothetical protein H4R20_000871 [Coemansia guatemalensis]
MDAQLLAPRIREILQQSDLSTVSAKKVRRQLENELNESLDTNKMQVDDIIKQQFQQLHNESQQRHQAQQQYAQQYSQQTGAFIPGVPGNGVSEASTPTAPRKRGRPRKAETEKKMKRKKRVLDPDRPKRLTGLSKPMKLSETLRDFLEQKYCARTDVVKELWKYIKAQGLQDPKDRRYILCDQKLTLLFNTDRLSMYEMNKLLNVHLVKPTPEENLEAIALLGLPPNHPANADSAGLLPSSSTNPSASQLPSNAAVPTDPRSPTASDTGVSSIGDLPQTGERTDDGANYADSPNTTIQLTQQPQSPQQPITPSLLLPSQPSGINDSNNL